MAASNAPGTCLASSGSGRGAKAAATRLAPSRERATRPGPMPSPGGRQLEGERRRHEQKDEHWGKP